MNNALVLAPASLGVSSSHDLMLCDGRDEQTLELWEKNAPPLSAPHDFIETEVACSKCQAQEN